MPQDMFLAMVGVIAVLTYNGVMFLVSACTG